MKKLNCDVVFYKDVNYGIIHCTNVEVGEELSRHYRKDSVEIGRISNVTVDIKDDVTQEHIDILKAQKDEIAAEAQIKMNNIEEQIQSLLAIEFKE